MPSYIVYTWSDRRGGCLRRGLSLLYSSIMRNLEGWASVLACSPFALRSCSLTPVVLVLAVPLQVARFGLRGHQIERAASLAYPLAPGLTLSN